MQACGSSTLSKQLESWVEVSNFTISPRSCDLIYFSFARTQARLPRADVTGSSRGNVPTDSPGSIATGAFQPMFPGIASAESRAVEALSREIATAVKALRRRVPVS
jgi:hypothetical protein